MKRQIRDYVFDAAARTVVLTEYDYVDHAAILLITNVTDGVIIYSFADPTKGCTVAGNVITLAHDTSSMSNTDALQILYDDPDTSVEDMTAAIRTLMHLAANPIHVDKSINRSRTTALIESGTVTAVTTVTGLTNVDGYQGKTIPINMSALAWAQVVRSRIS